MKRGRGFLGKDLALDSATDTTIQSVTSAASKKMIDGLLLTSIIRSHCQSFTIVDVGFSLSIVSRKYSVLSSDHLNLFLSFHRDTVWDGGAIDKNFRLEKSIATQKLTNYDLL